MKKISLLFILILLPACWNKSFRQGAYYNWPTRSNIVYWPIFTNYKSCKKWAINKELVAYNGYVFCSRDCHDSINWIPICKEAVRSRAPFKRSKTFDNYKK